MISIHLEVGLKLWWTSTATYYTQLVEISGPTGQGEPGELKRRPASQSDLGAWPGLRAGFANVRGATELRAVACIVCLFYFREVVLHQWMKLPEAMPVFIEERCINLGNYYITLESHFG